MLNYEGDTNQAICQEHHLVDHEIDDVNIESIIAAEYDQNIDNRTDNSYCAHIYNNPSNPNSEFASEINQISEISKMMGLIGTVTKSDTPCELFSDTIIGQLKQLEGYICDILSP